MKRALLLSGYHASSHARWARGLQDSLPEYEWVELSLPPRHFRWRLRGNAWWWALEEPLVRESYDLVVATSMVDLASLCGFVPTLAAVPRVTYFHENQFAYPTRDDELDMNLGLANVHSALAADLVVFNSEYNRRTMLEGIAEMRQKLPDFVPAQTAELIESRSRVIPVGLEEHCYDSALPATGPLQIVWNHRWEYDKAPEGLFAALRRMKRDFEVHVVGQQFRQIPHAMEEGRRLLGDRIKTWGFVESAEEYRDLLRRCDVVVSTAIHEFQGLAVLEAVAAGCVAAVPDRLAYPEFLPEFYLYEGHEKPEREARNLARLLDALADRKEELRAAAPYDLSRLRWSNLAGEWREALTGLIT